LLRQESEKRVQGHAPGEPPKRTVSVEDLTDRLSAKHAWPLRKTLHDVWLGDFYAGNHHKNAKLGGIYAAQHITPQTSIQAKTL